MVNFTVEESISGSKIDAQKSRNNSEEYVWLETEGSEETTLDINKPVSFAKIYAKREDIVRKHKLRIGLLSSSLLENPEFKVSIYMRIICRCEHTLSRSCRIII